MKISSVTVGIAGVVASMALLLGGCAGGGLPDTDGELVPAPQPDAPAEPSTPAEDDSLGSDEGDSEDGDSESGGSGTGSTSVEDVQSGLVQIFEETGAAEGGFDQLPNYEGFVNCVATKATEQMPDEGLSSIADGVFPTDEDSAILLASLVTEEDCIRAATG